MECLCFENYIALIIDGEPPLSVLQDKWLSIYSEFINLSDETDVLFRKSLQANVIVLEARITKIHLCVNALISLGGAWEAYNNDEEAISLYDISVEALRKLNFKYKYDPYDKTYYEDLNMVLSRTKTWELQLELKQSEIDAIDAKNSGERVSPVYFTRNIIRISEHFKFMISAKTLMTAEYCFLKRDYIEDINRIKNARNR